MRLGKPTGGGGCPGPRVPIRAAAARANPPRGARPRASAAAASPANPGVPETARVFFA